MKYLILGLGCLLASHSYANSREQIEQWKDRIVQNQDSQAAYEFAEYSYKEYVKSSPSLFTRKYHSALYDMALQLGYPVPTSKVERMKLYERMTDVCAGYAVNHNQAGSVLSDRDFGSGIDTTDGDRLVMKLKVGCQERNAKYEQEALKLGVFLQKCVWQ